MVDRLADLGLGNLGREDSRKKSSVTFDPNGDRPLLDAEEPEVEQERNESLDAYFAEVGKVKEKMSVIRRNVKLIEQKHGQGLTNISIEQGKQNAMVLEDLTDETQDNANQIRNMLKKMGKNNEEFIEDRKNKASTEGRIRVNLHATLARKFVELMSEQQEVQTKYKGKYRERVERQYKIVNPNATREELDSVGNPESIFADQIMTPGHAAAKNALADIQDRHKDIMKLEASIRDLAQLFQEMAVMVETQGELLDQIENHVVNSERYVAQGVVQLGKARDYQKSRRKKIMIAICLVIIILCVLITPLVLNGTIGGN